MNRLERPIVVGAVQARARARSLQHRQRDAARHHASRICTPHRLTTVRAVARPFARVVTAPEQSGSRRSAQRTTMALVMKNGHRSARRSQYSPSTCFEQLHCAAPTAVPGTLQCQSNRRPTRELRLEPRTAAGSDTAELKSLTLQFLSREEAIRGYIAAGWAVSCSECSPPPSLPFLQPLTLPRASACRMHDARARSSRLTNRMGRGLCRLGARGDSCGRLAKPSERRAGGPRRLTRLKAGVGHTYRRPPVHCREL